jgi:hypothetical protein
LRDADIAADWASGAQAPLDCGPLNRDAMGWEREKSHSTPAEASRTVKCFPRLRRTRAHLRASVACTRNGHHSNEYRLYDHSISRQRLLLPHCSSTCQSVFCTDTPGAERNKKRDNMNPRKIIDLHHHIWLQRMCRGWLQRPFLQSDGLQSFRRVRLRRFIPIASLTMSGLARNAGYAQQTIKIGPIAPLEGALGRLENPVV